VHATQSNATLDVLYILSNERGAWIHGLKKTPQKDGWAVVASQDLVLDAEHHRSDQRQLIGLRVCLSTTIQRDSPYQHHLRADLMSNPNMHRGGRVVHRTRREQIVLLFLRTSVVIIAPCLCIVSWGSSLGYWCANATAVKAASHVECIQTQIS
jgi:hypothetical protein